MSPASRAQIVGGTLFGSWGLRPRLLHCRSGRPGDYPPGPPQIPDVRISRIRLLCLWVRARAVPFVDDLWLGEREPLQKPLIRLMGNHGLLRAARKTPSPDPTSSGV